MQRYLLIDVIIFLAACNMFLLLPLRNEYIYKRVSDKHNFTKEENNSFCISNESKNKTKEEEEVAQEASKWTLYIDMTLLVPAIVSGAVINAWSDRVGRKVTMAIPLGGLTLGSAIQALIIAFNWPLPTMFAYSLVCGLTGYYMTALMQGMAYLSDVTETEKRGQRFTILETVIGIGAGASSLAGGFWTNAKGYLPPTLSTIAMAFVAFILVFFLPNALMIKVKNLQDSDDEKEKLNGAQPVRRNSNNYNEKSGLLENHDPPKEKLIHSIKRVYMTNYCKCNVCHGYETSELKSQELCPHRGGYIEGKIWRLWLYLASYSMYMFVTVGIMAFQTIFYLDYPLCFTTAMVGIQAAIRFSSNVLSPVVLLTMKRLSVTNNGVILTSILFYVLFSLLLSFSKQPWVVYVATTAMIFASLAKPLIQAQMSGLASEFEQGAMFSLLSSAEILSFMFGTVIYLLMYPATQSISHWFCWYFSAAILLIPLAFVSVIWIADKRRGGQEMID